MPNFWFWDKETGEEFIVQEDTKEKAWATAKEYFESPKLLDDNASDYECEMSGLDVY